MFGLPDGVSACLFDMHGVAGHFGLVVGVDRVGQAGEPARDRSWWRP